ncbi:MAG: Transketolase, N-terminal section, partial [uncultured Thermomicrobiales bacterium]
DDRRTDGRAGRADGRGGLPGGAGPPQHRGAAAHPPIHPHRRRRPRRRPALLRRPPGQPLLRPAPGRSRQPGMARARPLHPLQGSLFDRPLRRAGAARLPAGGGVGDLRRRRLPPPGPPGHDGVAGARHVDRLPRPGALAGRRHGPRGAAPRAAVPDLGDRRRRRDPGGADLGGGLHRGPPRARHPLRHRRLQPPAAVRLAGPRRLHADRAGRRPDRKVPGLRLARGRVRRSRPRRDPGRLRRRRGAPRPADLHRCPHRQGQGHLLRRGRLPLARQGADRLRPGAGRHGTRRPPGRHRRRGGRRAGGGRM